MTFCALACSSAGRVQILELTPYGLLNLKIVHQVLSDFIKFAIDRLASRLCKHTAVVQGGYSL